MITVNINGKEISLDESVTVLEAARKAGINIPTLCNHKLLESFGGCRLCVVEVERMPKLMTACTLMAADGMVVKTESETISKARRAMLEFLLINHPLDCPYCDKAGECELQDVVMQYGPPEGRFKEEKRKVPESHDDPILSRNMERCIVCTRCVRMCEDVQGASAIAMLDRGGRTVMEPFSSRSFNCEYCGNCLTACPVGSILSRLYIHSYRPWQLDREVETICGYCGVGCTLIAQTRDESIIRVIPQEGLGLNNGLLCAKGRFGYDFTSNPDRLRTPLIRKGDALVESSWDEALDLVANRMLEIKKESGGASIGGIASPRCTNEDNYVFQKFIRMACGSNNIDSISRTGFAAAQKYFENLLGQGISANIISGIKKSDSVLVLGGDPTAVNPILGLSIRAAAKGGAKVAVMGHAPGLERFKTLKLAPAVFKEAEALEALLAEIFRAKGKRGESQLIDEAISSLSERLSEKITAKGFDELKDILMNSLSTSIVLGMDLVQRSDGNRVLFAIAGLTYLLEARLYLLSERPNEQGLIDMGCVPDMLPGGRPVEISDFRKRYEDKWKGPVPDDEGLTLMEIIRGAKDRGIKALYIMGDNPVFNLPDSSFTREALSSLDLLVVQDVFLTETAKLADVVLPALAWSEEAGTYTNLERRVQLLRKAVDSSSGVEDWKIISNISTRMGYEMYYSDARAIMDEISRVSPLYRSLTHDEITGKESLWPYNGEPLRGEIKGFGSVIIEGRVHNSDLYLVDEKILFHSGSLSQRSSALMRIDPEPLLKIGSQLADRLKLADGDKVSINNDRGSIEVAVSIDASLSSDKVLLSNNFKDKGAFDLLGYNLDPVTKAPGIDGCEISIRKVVT
jgi:NADH-quinone oxidoreductase chain G